MNYFLLLSIFLSITAIVMLILWLKERRLRRLNISQVKSIQVELETLREAFRSVSKTAEEAQDNYKYTLELYKLTRDALKETQEDLDYAKAIITGDLSQI